MDSLFLGDDSGRNDSSKEKQGCQAVGVLSSGVKISAKSSDLCGVTGHRATGAGSAAATSASQSPPPSRRHAVQGAAAKACQCQCQSQCQCDCYPLPPLRCPLSAARPSPPSTLVWLSASSASRLCTCVVPFCFPVLPSAFAGRRCLHKRVLHLWQHRPRLLRHHLPPPSPCPALPQPHTSTHATHYSRPLSAHTPNTALPDTSPMK